jgi:hypothetical protein
MDYQEHKLKELVIYIAKKSEDDPNFGKTKLLKLLAYSDFRAFQRYGRPITGATYIKLEHGPAPRGGGSVLDLLRLGNRIQVIDEDAYGYTQNRVVAIDEPDPAAFNEAELAIVDEVIERFSHLNNTDIRNLSHRDFVGWDMVDERDPIPYESVFLAPPEPVRPEELPRIHALVQRAEALEAEAG